MKEESARNPMMVHQPILLCVDTSSSMKEISEDGKTKIQIVEDLINNLATISFDNDYDTEIDLCIITFNDKVETVVDWIPLTEFQGEIKLKAEGSALLGSAVITAIDETRKRRYLYSKVGAIPKQAEICLITDGYSTESLDDAYEICRQYLTRPNLYDKPNYKMYITLVPPHAEVEKMRLFGDNIVILRINQFDFKQGIFQLNELPDGRAAETSHISITLPEIIPFPDNDFEWNDDVRGDGDYTNDSDDIWEF